MPNGTSLHFRHRGREESFERRCMTKPARSWGVGRASASSPVVPRGGKGKTKARVNDKTIHKATRAARKVTPGGGEASDRARPEQAACHSEGQVGAAGDMLPSLQPCQQELLTSANRWR